MKNPLLKILLQLLALFYVLPLPAADIPIIAAATNVKFAMQEIAAAFHQDTGHSVRFSFASSGNLSRQIQQGAPFELFLSANMDFVEHLQQQKLAQGNKIVFAIGRVVLLTTTASSLILDEQLLTMKQAVEDGDLQRFAIANPKHAPYGIAAREVLMHQQLWSELQPFLVMGENVAQAAQFSSSGAAQAGIVSYSLALVPALQNKTRFVLIPDSFHQPLKQVMVLLNNAGVIAQQFYRYLLQEKARNILSRSGYTTP
jgi:molybdate transport system substrate-binding protein